MWERYKDGSDIFCGAYTSQKDALERIDDLALEIDYLSEPETSYNLELIEVSGPIAPLIF